MLLLWWHDTPATLHTFGDWLTNAGRITGLLAGYVIIVLLLLMARVPSLERGLGADRLARWHAMGGRYAISLAVAHTLLIIWGYAVSAHESVIPQTGALLTQYPDVMMATVALGLLILVAGVSMRVARAHMRYETWYYLHFYTYLAVALSFSHEFSTGLDFSASQSARVLWSLLYISIAALLFWYRFVVPIRAALRHRMVVAGVFPEAPGIFSVHVTGHHLDDLRAEPGSVLPVAVLEQRKLVAVTSVLAVRAAVRQVVAHHGEGARRSLACIAHLAQGHAGVCRGTVRRAH